MNKTLGFLKEGAICAEIGVWKGDFSKEILKKNPSKLYLIDPWESITNVPARWHAAPQDEMDKIYESVLKKFEFDSNVSIMREFSNKASTLFVNEHFDWLYLDANHSYEYVKEDLNCWWDKLVSGGYFCLDDYQEGKYQIETLDFGVVKAVDEFVINNKNKIKNFKVIKDQVIIEKL